MIILTFIFHSENSTEWFFWLVTLNSILNPWIYITLDAELQRSLALSCCPRMQGNEYLFRKQVVLSQKRVIFHTFLGVKCVKLNRVSNCWPNLILIIRRINNRDTQKVSNKQKCGQKTNENFNLKVVLLPILGSNVSRQSTTPAGFEGRRRSARAPTRSRSTTRNCRQLSYRQETHWLLFQGISNQTFKIAPTLVLWPKTS